jgi:hypothetical protein
VTKSGPKIEAAFWRGRERLRIALAKDCRFCGQPMKPKGVKKLPDEYDHAQGCPYSRKRGRAK